VVDHDAGRPDREHDQDAAARRRIVRPGHPAPARRGARPGSGKSTLSGAIADLLRESGWANAVIDLDALTMVYPHPERSFALNDLRVSGPITRLSRVCGSSFQCYRGRERTGAASHYRAELTVRRLRADRL
jgi:hypothetical protein